MLRYLKQRQKQLHEDITSFYTKTGIHVFVKNKITNDDVNLELVMHRIENTFPKHLLKNVEMVIVGDFPEFEERSINAFYKDSALYVSPEQDNDDDLYDDLVHEISHSLEEEYGEFIYGDMLIQQEFLRKREHIYNILWKMGHKAPKKMFLNTDYDEEFDEFLYKTIGYDKLATFMSGIFITPYAATDLREYFGVGFTEYFMDNNHEFFKNTCPSLYDKINSLVNEEPLD